MPYVNVCIANEEDAADVLASVRPTPMLPAVNWIGRDTSTLPGSLATASILRKVAITLPWQHLRNDNDWAGMLYSEGQAYFSPNYRIHIVDRVGGGDSFGGGLIHSLLKGFEPQQAINYAVAASCLKHTIEGDFNQVSESDVLGLAGGNATGRVQR